MERVTSRNSSWAHTSGRLECSLEVCMMMSPVEKLPVMSKQKHTKSKMAYTTASATSVLWIEMQSVRETDTIRVYRQWCPLEFETWSRHHLWGLQ